MSPVLIHATAKLKKASSTYIVTAKDLQTLVRLLSSGQDPLNCIFRGIPCENCTPIVSFI